MLSDWSQSWRIICKDKVHLNTISNGELSDPLCKSVNRGLTLVRLHRIRTKEKVYWIYGWHIASLFFSLFFLSNWYLHTYPGSLIRFRDVFNCGWYKCPFFQVILSTYGVCPNRITYDCYQKMATISMDSWLMCFFDKIVPNDVSYQVSCLHHKLKT